MSTTCAPTPAYEELLLLLEMNEGEQKTRLDLLLQNRIEVQALLRGVDDQIARLQEWSEFTATLRQQVEAGYMPAERALVELVPRHFSASEFIGNLHEFGRRRAS